MKENVRERVGAIWVRGFPAKTTSLPTMMTIVHVHDFVQTMSCVLICHRQSRLVGAMMVLVVQGMPELRTCCVRWNGNFGLSGIQFGGHGPAKGSQWERRVRRSERVCGEGPRHARLFANNFKMREGGGSKRRYLRALRKAGEHMLLVFLLVFRDNLKEVSALSLASLTMSIEGALQAKYHSNHVLKD